MKLFFISDIHGAAGRLEAVLNRMDSEGGRHIAILGDILNHGPRNPLPEGYDTKRTAALLNERRDSIAAVRGNCDSEVDQMVLEFPIMADHSWLFSGEHRMFLTHGHRFSPASLPPLGEGDAFVYGHNHIPQAERVNGHFFLNPGSISLPKSGTPAAYGVLEDGIFTVRELATHEPFLSCDLR